MYFTLCWAVSWQGIKKNPWPDIKLDMQILWIIRKNRIYIYTLEKRKYKMKADEKWLCRRTLSFLKKTDSRSLVFGIEAGKSTLRKKGLLYKYAGNIFKNKQYSVKNLMNSLKHIFIAFIRLRFVGRIWEEVLVRHMNNSLAMLHPNKYQQENADS